MNSESAAGADMHAVLNEHDRTLMARCIALARASAHQSELPFAALVCQDGVVIAEATNRVARDGDVTHHAELLAVSKAQRRLKSKRLRGCTLYSVVEPCAMCAFPIRETGISRVVFSLKSPVMGGFTRWNVLGDPLLARTMPVFFSQPPEVVSGLLAYDAEAAWRAWNPVLWALIKMRGCIVAGGNESHGPGSCDPDASASNRNDLVRAVVRGCANAVSTTRSWARLFSRLG
jgi:tRNA(adenine34) deaminase